MTTTAAATRWTVDTLAEAFAKARDAALAADPGEGEDGGTCNLDTPTIKVPRVREAVMHEAAERAGISVSKINWFGVRYFVHVPMNGQAWRREKMADAASQSLKESGLDELQWQQCD